MNCARISVMVNDISKLDIFLVLLGRSLNSAPVFFRRFVQKIFHIPVLHQQIAAQRLALELGSLIVIQSTRTRVIYTAIAFLLKIELNFSKRTYIWVERGAK